MQINKLLNPICGDGRGHNTPDPPVLRSIPHRGAPLGGPKRQRIAKDAPIFTEGIKTSGHINFPAHELHNDSDLTAQHHRFQVYPLGEIQRRGVRHIPYNSDRKDFLEKTGRDSFEVFHYTYKVPGDDKEYVVVWDYNVGLVRITPFFKSLKYTKTIPAKALKDNPGLKEVSYSITGGALVCQGYWFPYEAAKAIAATFCYEIRWALTPVFGRDFPSICLPPNDPQFGKFVIDPRIVQDCITETNRFRVEGPKYRIAKPRAMTPIRTPEMKFDVPRYNLRSTDTESEYESVGQSDGSLFSPQLSPRSRCAGKSEMDSATPYSQFLIDSPVEGSPMSTIAPIFQKISVSQPVEYHDELLRAKRTLSSVTIRNDYNEKALSRPPTAVAENYGIEEQVRGMSPESDSIRDDIEAARALLLLSAADGKLKVSLPKRCRCG